MFTTDITVEWGDCDEAGIVFYPNYFYWFDCTFGRLLRDRGLSKRALQERFGAVVPLVDVGATFRRPAHCDDRLDIALAIESWAPKRFRLAYAVTCGDAPVATGFEERAWARVDTEGRLRGHDIDAEFRRLLS